MVPVSIRCITAAQLGKRKSNQGGLNLTVNIVRKKVHVNTHLRFFVMAKLTYFIMAFS